MLFISWINALDPGHQEPSFETKNFMLLSRLNLTCSIKAKLLSMMISVPQLSLWLPLLSHLSAIVTKKNVYLYKGCHVTVLHSPFLMIKTLFLWLSTAHSKWMSFFMTEILAENSFSISMMVLWCVPFSNISPDKYTIL
jgi:hypothetical protein